jgi:hypothetical protein
MVSQRSAKGQDIPDYLGIDAIHTAFDRQPDAPRAQVKARMLDLLERCKGLSDGQPTDILNRLAVVFDARE